MDDFYQFVVPNLDTVFYISRAMVLGILVSSEALLARRRRIGFERHLILFSAFGFLMAAELFGAVIGLGESPTPLGMHGGVWVWYPVLSCVGLVGVAFCFDFVRSGAGGVDPGEAKRDIRWHRKRYFLAMALLLALGALLCGKPFEIGHPPTSHLQMGQTSYVLHGLQVAALLLVAWKARSMSGAWLSRLESDVFLLGCVTGVAGAVIQVFTGPREFLTTLAFAIFVAVFLRDNYRRSEREAVRASEDRNAKMLLFHRVTTQLKSSFDPERLYEILMDSLMSSLGAESGAIYIRDDGNIHLNPVLIHGPYPPPLPLEGELPDTQKRISELVRQTTVPVGEGVVGRVAESGIPIYLFDSEDAARYYAWPAGPIRVNSTIVLPLHSPEGVYGVVQIVNRLDGSAFAEEDLRFMSLFVEQAGLAIYNARLHAQIIEQHRTEEQLKIARQIQLRLIPAELPRFPGVSVGAEYFPAQEVGGDYYDLYRIDHDHVGVVVFDVAGKGVPGALLMAITSTFLKMAAPRATSPAWVLNEVNAALWAEMRRDLYVTALYGALQLSTFEFTFCCAGHTDTILIRERDGFCQRYKPRGAALGLLRPNRFRSVLEQKTIRLEPGDTLLFYTDGVTEAMNEQLEEFGEERLTNVAREFRRHGPQSLATGIAEAVRKHAGQHQQYDDITVLALRVSFDADDSGKEAS